MLVVVRTRQGRHECQTNVCQWTVIDPITSSSTVACSSMSLSVDATTTPKRHSVMAEHQNSDAMEVLSRISYYFCMSTMGFTGYSSSDWQRKKYVRSTSKSSTFWTHPRTPLKSFKRASISMRASQGRQEGQSVLTDRAHWRAPAHQR
jgi:hypothetical protein